MATGAKAGYDIDYGDAASQVALHSMQLQVFTVKTALPQTRGIPRLIYHALLI
jgi:hypothetical protein